MRTLTWRNLLARKVRLLLSALSIVLGVAFVAGSLIFTDTMQRAFDGIVSGTVADVAVRPADGAIQTGGGPPSPAPPPSRGLPASLVDELAALPEVARADGSVDGAGLFVAREDGRLLGGTGAPTLTFNYSDAPNTLGDPTITVAEGRAPSGPGEVALDARSAERAGYAVGDDVTLLGVGDPPQREAELVGTVDFAGGGLAGATLVVLDTATAQELFLDGADTFTSIAVAAAPGVSQDELARAVAPVVPQGFEAVTGDDAAAELEGIIGEVLGFLTTFLLVFGAIALVVGTFLIVNTFSILVAQRSRELALLRALGASRRQVTRSVLGEALAVGLVGSTLGLLLGFGLAAGLRVLFASVGLDLAATPLVLEWRTPVAAYAVGVLVTLVAGYLPARRASRVPPVAAMRDDVALPESSVRRRAVVAVVLAALGAGLLVWGLVLGGGYVTAKVGLGILCVLLAIALASPVLAVPVLAATGVLYRWLFGTVGLLAWQNARRNPRRTAATASALMIGLALVTTMSVIGASVNASITDQVEEDFASDYLVSNAIGLPFDPAVADDLARVDGVAGVAAVRALPVTFAQGSLDLTAVDPGALERVVDPTWTQGRAPEGDAEVALDEGVADDLDIAVGDVLDLDAAGAATRVEVVGLLDPPSVLGSGVVPDAVAARVSLEPALTAAAVAAEDGAEDGADPRALRDALEAATADVPALTVQDEAAFAEAQREPVDQLLLLIYALLGLAVVIAVLGIVNTLALSVVERTREVGLLRAVGLTRRQLRRMVRLESVAIAVLGALLGVAAGTGFGVLLQRSVADDGIGVLAIPYGRLAVFVAVAAVVGVLAAVLPARRAARLDVLRAIGTD